MRSITIFGLSCAAVAALLPDIAVADLQWNLKPVDGALYHSLNDLHLMIMIIISVIFVAVVGFMFFAIFRHRKSLGRDATHFHERTTVEIIWTVVPLLIIIGMAWPATRVLLEIRNTTMADITIKATRYQSKWAYAYLVDGVNFENPIVTSGEKTDGKGKNDESHIFQVDKPMVVPVGRKVRVLIASNDVAQSRHKAQSEAEREANVGGIRDAWFRADETGTFRVPCADWCGSDDDSTSIIVKVVSDDDYKRWLELQKTSAGGAFYSTPVNSFTQLRAVGAAIQTGDIAALRERAIPVTTGY